MRIRAFGIIEEPRWHCIDTDGGRLQIDGRDRGGALQAAGDGDRRSLLSDGDADEAEVEDGDVVISLEGDHRRAQHGSAYIGRLEHWNYHTFRPKRQAAWRCTSLATFGIDANGLPSRLEMMGARFVRKETGR
jgi:hypothetical protein